MSQTKIMDAPSTPSQASNCPRFCSWIFQCQKIGMSRACCLHSISKALKFLHREGHCFSTRPTIFVKRDSKNLGYVDRYISYIQWYCKFGTFDQRRQKHHRTFLENPTTRPTRKGSRTRSTDFTKNRDCVCWLTSSVLAQNPAITLLRYIQAIQPQPC